MDEDKQSFQEDKDPEIYEVIGIKGPIEINGKGDHALWNKATVFKDFKLYWNAEDPNLTTFKALHDRENLYLYYLAEDSDIQRKLDTLKQIEAVQSDRVEIFFKGQSDDEPYYSLEMDCFGRVYDSEGKFGEYINGEWNWPRGHLSIQTYIGEDYYTLEARISKESLERLGLLQNDQILAGLYRADYVLADDGTRNPLWISWIDPQTPKPNFHIGSSFGTFILK